MYEVVFLRLEGKSEVRITDHPLKVGDRVEIDAATWEVVSEEPADDPDVDARFTLRRVWRSRP